ncbi:MAG: bifunctional DNA-formamidopyrimidine glycosylase/DNA-(apurinic or apyrimidinic site) lyase, partial [Myxococcales bacterium]|nr:bifunctional DNA-formamidopyrimidine glycosylase/DNA-(apurinic or apyrimidinic site) lyase [Myxococcales bacterium]
KTVTTTLKKQLIGKELGRLWHSSLYLRKAVDYGEFRFFENKKISDISCYGKVIFFEIENKTSLLAQLGMTGQLKVEDQDTPLALHTHLRWPLKESAQEIRYVDPRRFGLIDVCDEEKKECIINRLGPDPFCMTTKDYLPLIEAMKKSSRAIKEVLLDQAVIVGVGNIYASESLFMAGIDPKILACKISTARYQKLIAAVKDVMLLAYKNNGTSFSNYVDGSGKKGSNLEYLKVFQKEGENCSRCQTSIVRIKQGSRSTFYCPNCQK